MTKYSILGHEINEQYEYQQGNNSEYSEPGSIHMNSVAKESTMNGGWERGKNNNTTDKPPTKNVTHHNSRLGGYTSTVWKKNKAYNISYSKNGKTKVSTWQVSNGNVVHRN